MTPPGTEPAATADWRLEIAEARRRPIRIWLWCVALTTLAVLVVGGITRLTLSGLSIVEWNPIMGVIPPLGDTAWQEAFEAYQQFPEYRTWRGAMTLEEFRFIYFWEYLHRLLARAIGLVFLVPFVVFWLKGWFNRPLLRRALLLFALGAMQGVMGWLMVASGLVDRPSVSHYRLAAHLGLAFMIFGFAVWLTRELAVDAVRITVAAPIRRWMSRGLAVVGTLLVVQIVWGAFVAGLRGGKYYPTFPRMGGRWVPPELLFLDPAALNFVANPIAVQWAHRVIGTALLIATVVVTTRVLRAAADPRSRAFAAALLAGLAIQYVLGVLTLVNLVPVPLGVTHQVVALVLFGLWVSWIHHVRELQPKTSG
ncbi:MAG TPA: COX15/CtaA family protein [Longimicrobiales bacterium]|nr:COX15/CtaA family protein [Longimicrobiales bacterium]